MARYMSLSENDREQFFQEIYDLVNNTKRNSLAYAEGIYDMLDVLGLVREFNDWVDEIEQVEKARIDMPCDYTGCCAGTCCPIFFECQA